MDVYRCTGDIYTRLYYVWMLCICMFFMQGTYTHGAGFKKTNFPSRTIKTTCIHLSCQYFSFFFKKNLVFLSIWLYSCQHHSNKAKSTAKQPCEAVIIEKQHNTVKYLPLMRHKRFGLRVVLKERPYVYLKQDKIICPLYSGNGFFFF